MSVSLFFIMFTSGGNKNRYISFALKKEKKKANSYFRYITKLKFIVSLIISILILVLAYPLSNFIFRNSLLLLPLLVISIYAFVFSFNTFFTSLFYSIKKVKYLVAKETIFQVGRIILALLVFYFIIETYRVVGILFTLILISFIAILFSLFYVKKINPEIFKKKIKKIDKEKNKEVFLSFNTGNCSPDLLSFYRYDYAWFIFTIRVCRIL